jgi:ADP-ribosyl-[dinitrogen reductase] hydrolase
MDVFGGDGRGRALELIGQGVMRCEPGPVFHRSPAVHDAPAARLRDRVEGMLLGLAIGDALGNTTESQVPAQRSAAHGEIRDYLPNRHAGGRAVGLPSDDTQLAFRTLRRLLDDGGVRPERLARDFCTGRIFGIGHAMREFVHAMTVQGLPWHEAAQPSAGNGALMRIAPVLLPHLKRPSPALFGDAATASMVTHNDPASIGACVAFVDMLWQLLDREETPAGGWWLATFAGTLRDVEGSAPRYSPRTPRLQGETSLWRFTERLVSAALAQDMDTAAACDVWYSGAYLLETVPSVIYILERHADDPEEAIVRAVNDTKDNDTIAAIVGAAVGALHGRSALPERWLEGLAGRTAEDDDGAVFRLVDEASRAFVTG